MGASSLIPDVPLSYEVAKQALKDAKPGAETTKAIEVCAEALVRERLLR